MLKTSARISRLQPLFDVDLLRERNVGIAVRRSPNAGYTRADAQISAVGEERNGLEGGSVICWLVYVETAPGLSQNFHAGYKGRNALGLKLR